MQTTFHPDSTIEKNTLYIDGKPVQVLITFTKEKQEIFIHQISESLLVVHAPQGISLDEIKKQVRNYKNPSVMDEHSGTKKEHSALSGGTIHIKGLDIPYTVVYNPRRKTLYLSIYPDGRVVVDNPGTATEEDIIRFLNSEKEWIYKEYFCTRPECPPPYDDQTIQIADTIIPYRICRNTRCKRVTLKIHGNGKVEVSAPYDMPTHTIAAFVESRRSWIAPRVGISHPLPDHQGEQGNNGNAPGEETGEVTHRGERIPYTIKRSTRAKRIVIKVSRAREVCVVCPSHVRASDISAHMIQHAEWIYNHTVASTRPLPLKRTYEDGEIFPCLGESVTIRIRRGEGVPFVRSGHELIITIPAEYTDYYTKKAIKEIISAYYAEELYKFSKPLFHRYADILQIPVPPIKVRDQKTKWGTCTPRSIILNIRLCMAPCHIIEYVIVHELAHKIHPNHSPWYWSLVEHLMPDYKVRREYLKNHGHEWVL